MTLETARLLEGAVDTHVHSAPDLVERKLDDFAVAQQARAAGMAGLVLKNHFFPTALRARLVAAQVPGVAVIGSIVLNQSMGGMNPWAVEAAARAGAKVVWLPTAHAAHQLRREAAAGGRPHPAALVLPGHETAVHVFEPGNGHLTAAAEAVLEIVRDRHLVLATGHLSPDEVEQLTARAIDIGCRRIVATHPDHALIAMPVALQHRLADRGVFFERTFNVTRPPYVVLSPDALAARIREVGPSSTILATDFGQPINPTPAEGMQQYVEALATNGFSADEIRTMASRNARALLDL